MLAAPRVWRGQKIAVVVPAYNEARHIRQTLARVPNYVDRIFVVDDASRDDTWQVLRSVKDKRVVRVQHTDNQGVGAAIVSGYLRAIRDDALWIAVMAGDDQMAPEDLSHLLEATELQEDSTGSFEGRLWVDYVKGNRFLHPESRRMPALRRLGSRALSWLTRSCTGLNVDDCQCGYTLIRASTAAELPLSLMWPRYGYPNDLLALLAQSGKNVREVPVTPVYKDEQSGLHPGHVLSIATRVVRRWALQGAPKTL